MESIPKNHTASKYDSPNQGIVLFPKRTKNSNPEEEWVGRWQATFPVFVIRHVICPPLYRSTRFTLQKPNNLPII